MKPFKILILLLEIFCFAVTWYNIKDVKQLMDSKAGASNKTDNPLGGPIEAEFQSKLLQRQKLAPVGLVGVDKYGRDILGLVNLTATNGEKGYAWDVDPDAATRESSSPSAPFMYSAAAFLILISYVADVISFMMVFFVFLCKCIRRRAGGNKERSCITGCLTRPGLYKCDLTLYIIGLICFIGSIIASKCGPCSSSIQSYLDQLDTEYYNISRSSNPTCVVPTNGVVHAISTSDPPREQHATDFQFIHFKGDVTISTLTSCIGTNICQLVSGTKYHCDFFWPSKMHNTSNFEKYDNLISMNYFLQGIVLGIGFFLAIRTYRELQKAKAKKHLTTTTSGSNGGDVEITGVRSSGGSFVGTTRDSTSYPQPPEYNMKYIQQPHHSMNYIQPH